MEASRTHALHEARWSWSAGLWPKHSLAMFAGVAIGWCSWGSSEQIWPLFLVCLFPLAWGAATSRFLAWALSIGYFMGAARGLPAGAVAFFGEGSPQWWGLAMWLGSSLLQSAPFALFWSKSRKRRAWGFIAAILLTVLPPLGIIGWVNPISIAGLLFPAWAWLGLVGTMGLFYVLVQRHWVGVLLIAVLAASANFAAKDLKAIPPAGWGAQDTQFSNMWSGGANYASQLMSSMERARWLSNYIDQLPEGQTVVLPETLLGRWDGVIEARLSHSIGLLTAKGSKVLVGAEMANETGGYRNALVVLGAEAGQKAMAVQSLPVPVSMWKPWADDGAEADFLGRGNTIQVGKHVLSASICYEQLISYSVLRLMADRPDLIAAVSNVWWASSTNIPKIQQQSISAYGRLFNVPVLVARNT